jgi:GR25 family glycosyltransferase involved in LPS biosynthesis
MEKKNIENIIKNYNALREIYVNDIINELYINKIINKIYVINLKSDKIRRNYIKILMEKYNINFELIIVPKITQEEYNTIENIKISMSELGCSISHLYCLNNAIKNNYENIIIFEDDIILHKNFHELFENIFSKQKYDLLMLGAADFGFSQTNYKLVDNVNKIYKPDLNTTYLYGSHASYYSLNAAKYVFEILSKNITFFDNNFIRFFKKFNNTAFICFPNLVIPELSTTNLTHNFCIIHNANKEKNYYDKCFKNLFNFNEYNFIYLDFFNKKNIFDTNLTYKENIINLLEDYYKEQKEIIIKRLVYDFFSVEDLIYISK